MALVMQTYDDPTNTWLDVVSVTQEVVPVPGSFGDGVAIRPILPVAVIDVRNDGAVSVIVSGGISFVTEIPLVRTIKPIAKYIPA